MADLFEDAPETVFARLFHSVMAISMIVLLATGFLPKVGLQKRA